MKNLKVKIELKKEIMRGHVPPERIFAYYRSQCIKDDTMALSIGQYFQQSPSTHKVISFQGSFHSDEYLGLFERTKKMFPTYDHLLIKIIPYNSSSINFPERYKGMADFGLFAPQN
jgi:hypothetical protein